MKYANNPQSFINGFYSSSRNVFLTVSVAIAMYGFSNSFKNSREHIVKDISLFILLFSLMLGSVNIIYFNRFLTNLENEQKRGDILPNYIDLQMLRTQSYLKIYFLVILSVLLAAGFIRFVNRRFN
tara:strand:+ start:466 stop:843 length:378 start_codon:yes stop_codon:yes gene_type:complete